MTSLLNVIDLIFEVNQSFALVRLIKTFMYCLIKIVILALTIFIVSNISYAQSTNTYKENKLTSSKIGNITYEYKYDALGSRIYYKVTRQEIPIIDLALKTVVEDIYLYKNSNNEFPISIINLKESNAGGFYINTYLSNDSEFHQSNTLLLKKYVGGINAKDTINTNLSIKIPDEFIHESAYLILNVDPTNLIKETNESNNRIIVPVSIQEYTNSTSEVNFIADIQFGCSGTEVQFTDQSPNNPFEWNWVFPGGSPSFSDEQNPKVIYYTEGVFPVTLTLVNENGTFSKQETDIIEISNNPLVTFDGIPDVLSPQGGEFTIYINNECGTTLEWYAQLEGLNADWLTMKTPMSGSKPGFITLQYEASEGYTRTAQLFINALNVKNGEQTIVLTQGIELNNTQNIKLNKGWNLISFYVKPDDASVGKIFESIAEKVEEVQNLEGKIYNPTISNSDFQIDFKEAVWVKVSENTNLSIDGVLIDPETISIELKKGKNGVTFLGQPKTVQQALQSINDKLILVKTELDNYAPGYSILNSMDIMLPGKGYLIEVSEDVTLTYPKD